MSKPRRDSLNDLRDVAHGRNTADGIRFFNL